MYEYISQGYRYFAKLIDSLQGDHSHWYGVLISHEWGETAPMNTAKMDEVYCKAIRLISLWPLNVSLQSFHLCRSVASLSLFYRYYNEHCSSEYSHAVTPYATSPYEELIVPDSLPDLIPFLS